MNRIILLMVLVISFSVFSESKYITQLTDANFQKEVIESEMPVLVDFWAPWCGPCKKLGPIFEDLAKEHHKSMKFAKLNVDNNKKIASQYGIRSIPTVGIFKNGKPVDGFVGLLPKADIKDKIEGHFETSSENVEKEAAKKGASGSMKVKTGR